MYQAFCRIGKYAAIINRFSKIFYAQRYADQRIGSGQQYFLAWIYERPGITAGQLAQYGQYDKGTTAKAIQKLEAWGYIRAETDPHDQRIRRLYVQPAARPVIAEVYAARAAFNEVLTRDFTDGERRQLEELLRRAAENARLRFHGDADGAFPCATSLPSDDGTADPDLL